MGFYNTRMPRFKSKVNEALEKARVEATEKARVEAHAFDLSLIDKGYTKEQIREAFAQKYPDLAIA
jgi:hypothetical protein